MSPYTREELMNIRSTTPEDLLPTFLAAAVDLPDVITEGARASPHPVKVRRRGKRAGALVRLRECGFRTPLPGIFLSNVRSLCNELDGLQLLLRKNKHFSYSSVLCFTETWLCGLIPDSALQLAGFQLFRADHHTHLSGRKEGGGVCFYINSGWCVDVTVIDQHCSAHLESFFINCRPFYSPREFASFILVGVYIPPQACVQDAQRALANQILCVERSYPNSLVIVLGNFHNGNLTHELPKYEQFIQCPPREENSLDHCYTTVANAYRAVPRAAPGLSDRVMVHLIPSYRQRFCELVVRKSKKWSREAVEELRDSTDWDVFRTASSCVDEYTEAVTSYARFCEDCCIRHERDRKMGQSCHRHPPHRLGH